MSAIYRLILAFSAGLYCLTASATDEPETPDPAAETAVVTPSIPSAPRAPLLSRHVLAAQAIQLSADAKQLLDLTTPVEHFSALFLPANTAKPHGMVILLPGAEESFDWPLVVGPLRRKLPDAGWHTLSLNLPELPSPALPSPAVTASMVAEQIPVAPPEPFIEPDLTDSISDEEEDVGAEPEPDPEPVTPESSPPAIDADEVTEEPIAPPAIVIPAYPQRITNFIDAAIAYAQTFGAKEIILLGHREGAHWALIYQHEYGATQPLRTVLIAPRSSDLIHLSYETLIEASIVPIADFYYKNAATERQAAKQRLQASRRTAVKGYHQVGLTSAAGTIEHEQEQLFRRVKGWLNKGFNSSSK